MNVVGVTKRTKTLRAVFLFEPTSVYHRTLHKIAVMTRCTH